MGFAKEHKTHSQNTLILILMVLLFKIIIIFEQDVNLIVTFS